MALTKVRGAGAEGLTLSSTALTIANGLTLTDGDIAMASGHGISFAATGDAGVSTPSELLDDYEEGTFTPQILNGWGILNPTYSYNAGNYTKIGDLIYIHCQITLSGGSTNTNQLKVYGFPFTCASGRDTFIGGYFASANSNAENVFLQAVGGATTFNFLYKSATGITVFDGTHSGNSGNFLMSGVYRI